MSVAVPRTIARRCVPSGRTVTMFPRKEYAIRPFRPGETARAGDASIDTVAVHTAMNVTMRIGGTRGVVRFLT
jgi:hypothetical protein